MEGEDDRPWRGEDTRERTSVARGLHTPTTVAEPASARRWSEARAPTCTKSDDGRSARDGGLTRGSLVRSARDCAVPWCRLCEVAWHQHERKKKGRRLARARTSHGRPSCPGAMVDTIPFDVAEDNNRWKGILMHLVGGGFRKNIKSQS